MPYIKVLADKLTLVLGEDTETISYEIDLAMRAMVHDWTTQEIVNLIIAWRRKHNYPFIDEKAYYVRILEVCEKLLKLPVPDEAELSFVYFIEAVGAGQVKIGRANDPEKRLKQLQTSSPYPLKLLLLIPGGHDLEQELHTRFSHLRGEGEWFKLTSELLSYVSANKKIADGLIQLLFLHG